MAICVMLYRTNPNTTDPYWDNYRASSWIMIFLIGIYIMMGLIAVFVPKSCPNCKEQISRIVTKCPFCRTDVVKG